MTPPTRSSTPSGPTGAPPNPIAGFLESVHLAPQQAYKALTLWPLVLGGARGAKDGSLPCLDLADALERGQVVVEEVGPSGSVPHLRVTNRGAEAVLVLFGEELRGGRQNRVANASFLVPGEAELVIDVSCVEAGRWDPRPRGGFRSSAHVISHDMLRKMAHFVTESRERGGRFETDQGEIWSDVAHRIAWSHTESPNSAYADYLRKRAADLAEIGWAFRPVPGQVGFVAAIGGAVVGLEAVATPGLLARLFERLLRSYAIDAADSALLRNEQRQEPDLRPFDAPEPFLEALAATRATRSDSLGLGSDIRLAGAGIAGCALVTDEVVHLTAFPVTRSPGSGGGGGRTRTRGSDAGGGASWERDFFGCVFPAGRGRRGEPGDEVT